jgi:predicted nucleic acid-binding protein
VTPPQAVVSDTSPLILLGRTGRLGLLRDLFQAVLIPPSVLAEATMRSDDPGAPEILAAVDAGWLRVVEPASTSLPRPARVLAGRGEADAIALALERGGTLLLMDDRLGRRSATAAGLRVAGTGAMAVLAARRGLEPDAEALLDRLVEAGLRMSPSVRAVLRSG